jgi:hypothetical protein
MSLYNSKAVVCDDIYSELFQILPNKSSPHLAKRGNIAPIMDGFGGTFPHLGRLVGARLAGLSRHQHSLGKKLAYKKFGQYLIIALFPTRIDLRI